MYKSLEDIPWDIDVVFVLLSGAGGAKAADLFYLVEKTGARLTAMQRKVSAVVLDPLSEEYADLVKEHSVALFPSVIALGRGGESMVLDGDVRKFDLSRAFLVASAGCGSTCGSSD